MKNSFWGRTSPQKHAYCLITGQDFNSLLKFFFFFLSFSVSCMCLVFSDGIFCDVFCVSFQDFHSFPADHSLPWGPLFRAMVVCHSLIVWEGKIQGDPLDVKMFEATNWVTLRFAVMQIVVGSFDILAKEKYLKLFHANSHFPHKCKTVSNK